MADLISKGYDPAPIGKYPIKKILADSDLDGVMSASILKVVYPEAEVLQGEATGMEQGIYDELIDESTLIVDLKYIEGCGLYFDHHESNKPDTDSFPGRWMNLNSATEVCYEYYKNDYDLSKFEPYIEAVGKFDMALFSLDEYLNPDMILQLGLIIDRNDFEFNIYLVEQIVSGTVASAFADKRVAEKAQTMMEGREKLFAYIKAHGRVQDKIAIVDVTEYLGYEKIAGPTLNAQFPEADAIIAFKRRKKGSKRVKVRFYRNTFNKNSKDIDLLDIAKKMNSHAGGHRGACGYLLEGDETMEESIQKFLELVKTYA